MGMTYAYRGDEPVGSYLARCLGDQGHQCVADVTEAEVVFTHCYHIGAIEDAYFDDGGLIKEAVPGTLLVDLSASTPSLARELSAVATVNDLRFVEAPLAVVDPFDPRAWDDPAAMECYLSGEADDRAAALPLARLLAASVHEVGNYGNAQLAKAMRTTVQAASVISAMEADALFHVLNERGYGEGADPLLDVSFGAAFTQANKLASSHEFENRYTVALFMSDVAAAMATADDGELILPQLEASLHILELAGVIGCADRGLSILALLYRDEAEGVEAGLDWSRAQGLYAEDYGEFDEGGYEGEGPEGFGFGDGYGGYSSN